MIAKASTLLLSGLLLAPSLACAEVHPEPAPAPPGLLWHLPDSAAGFRVTGETGSLTWPVYVPASAARALKTFQLGFQAAIEVMPEASFILLRVNGQVIGKMSIAAPTGVRTVSIDVPPGLLQPGWNAVTAEVSQRHRVDCSTGATYELWTQVDPARTGFVGAPPAVASLADLPAVQPGPDGATHIHMLLPRTPSPEGLSRGIAAVERAALRGHYSHPVVDTARAADGLTLLVGTGLDLDGVPEAAGNAGVRLVATPEGAPALVVSGATGGEVDRAVAALGAGGPDPTGTEDGLRALARADGMRLPSGGSLPLAAFGLRSRTFSGRLFREAFDVVLPSDAYLADYAEARFSLDGGYAAGLTRDAKLLVRVNGVVDGEVDFDQPGGAVLQGQVVHMPLEPFRPGRNRIEVEAQLPAETDAACDTLTSIGAKERFLLLGTSTLSLPPLARVAQFPSLSASFSGGFAVHPDAGPRVVVPRLTEAAAAATATLLANAAVGVGAPTGATIARGALQPGSDSALVVGDPSDLPAALFAAAGLDARSVAAAWATGALPRPPSGTGEAAATDTARLNAWGTQLQPPEGLFSHAGTWLGALGATFGQSLRAAGLLDTPDQSLDVSGDTSFVIAQGLLGGAPLTLVTARDDGALVAGAATLTQPSRLAALDGRAAALDDGAPGTTLVPARNQALFRTQGLSLVNDRLVAAGWVSKHAGWYIGAVLAIAMALGLSTWLLLRGTRRDMPA